MAETARVAGTEVSLDHYIGGQRVPSDDRFEDMSPIDEHLLGAVSRGTADVAESAVDAALEGFETWRHFPQAERAAALHRVADGIEERITELAAVETEDNGALLRSHVRGVMPRVVHNFRFFADWLSRLGHDDFVTRGHINHVSWDPAGVAALITPWNAPLMLATWRVAPALAAGNAVVLKPAEWSPLTASLLADITHEAGLPPGVFNVVQGYGEEVGDALVSDPRVARIGFTGSVPTARRIASRAGRNLVPVSFELGGKSPFIVCGDADLDLAVDLAVGQFDNAGQVCLAGTRLLVDCSLVDDFTERFVRKALQLRQGDPRHPDTDIGPQITRAHLKRIEGFVERAKSDGAEVVIGGCRNSELGGLYYKPTLLRGAAPGSEILTEEVFGPVLTLQSFSSEDEAIRLANSTRFGLAAVVITSDEARAERLSSHLVAGTVWVNCFFVRDLRAPFGGSKESGIGREGGTWSFDFYCDLKNSVFAPERFRPEPPEPSPTRTRVD
ncbi:MAG: aldehyde dehydrogenase [Acidimicrobiales bacterium]